MEFLYKFEWDCGRQGTVTGIFVAKKEEIEEVIGKGVYFGEILGKHSEVYGTLEASEFKILSDDQDYIKKTKEIFGKTIHGYNPLDYLNEDE